MKKTLVALLLIFCSAVSAQSVYNGHWGNVKEESGRGMNVDYQNGKMVVNFYSYNPDGTAQWHQASGFTQFDEKTKKITFSEPMLRFKAGQCLACEYSGRPETDGDDGVITIVFSSPTNAEITLPGGRKATMIPYLFGIANGVHGMKGEWVFAYEKDGRTLYAAPYFSKLSAYNEGGLARIDSADGRFLCFVDHDADDADKPVFCMEENNSGTRITFFKGYLGPDRIFNGEVSSKADFTSAGRFDAFRRTWPQNHEKNIYSVKQERNDIALIPEDDLAALAKKVLRK